MCNTCLYKLCTSVNSPGRLSTGLWLQVLGLHAITDTAHHYSVSNLDTLPLVILRFCIQISDVQKRCCYLPVLLVVFILVWCYVWYFLELSWHCGQLLFMIWFRLYKRFRQSLILFMQVYSRCSIYLYVHISSLTLY